MFDLFFLNIHSFPPVLYAGTWILVTVLFFIKGQSYQRSLGGIMLVLYTLSSCVSIIFAERINYWGISGLTVNLSKLSISSYGFLFVCTFICIFPFLKNAKEINNNVITIGGDFRIINYFIYFSTPFILIAFCSLLYLSIHTNPLILSDIYEDTISGSSSIFDQLGWINKKAVIYISLLSFMWPLLFFVKLLDKNSPRVAFIPLLGLLSSLLVSYTCAARVGMVKSILYFIILLLLFKNSLSRSIFKKITMTLFACSLVIILLLSYITLSRFGDSKMDILSWLSLYAGEGCMRFSEYAWNISDTTNGDTNFSLIKSIFGFDTFTDSIERRDYYNMRLHVPTHIFYTFIGDLYFDLGLVGTFIFVCLFSYTTHVLIKNILLKKSISILSVFVISYIALLIVLGFTYNISKTFESQVKFVVIIIILLLINNLKIGSKNNSSTKEKYTH